MKTNYAHCRDNNNLSGFLSFRTIVLLPMLLPATTAE